MILLNAYIDFSSADQDAQGGIVGHDGRLTNVNGHQLQVNVNG